MSQRNWRDIMKEMEAANPQEDSLELGDSWNGMPRRTAGVSNKTNALFRRSVLPQPPTKNLYEFIIAKIPQPTNGARKTVNSNPANAAAVTKNQSTLMPNAQTVATDNKETNETLNFSEFLSVKNNDLNVVTSTPYPLRPIDANRSPTRTAGNVQRKTAESPKKLFVPTPTRIPISTPRTSRVLSISAQRPSYNHHPSDRNKMSSPVVSSTVDNGSNDDGEVRLDQAKSPDRRPISSRSDQDDRMSPTTENMDQNCAPCDEEERRDDAGAKASEEDEALFRRPQMIQRSSHKQANLEADDESQSDHSKLSAQLNSFQKSKKLMSKANPLLENYKKVGESLINRTNNVPLESSSSLSRRILYRKGDSCNEDEILKGMEPVEQQSCDLNPVPSNKNETFSKLPSPQPNANDRQSYNTTNSDPIVEKPDAETLQKSRSSPESERNDIADLPFDDDVAEKEENRNSSSHKVQHASPSKPDRGTEKDRCTQSSIDQQNHMKHSNKQVLEEILEDWSGDLRVSDANEKDGHTEASKETRPNIEKPASTESKVRQVRSKIQESDKTSSKTSRGGQVRTTLQQIQDESSTEEEDDISMNSLLERIVPVKKKNVNSVSKRSRIEKEAESKKSRTEPVHSTQQHDGSSEISPNSDENVPIVGEPSTRPPRTRNQDVEEKKVQTSKFKSRSTKRQIENRNESEGHKVKAGTKSKAKDKNNRLYVEDKVQEEDIVKVHEEEDDVNEVDLPTKSKAKPRKNRLNVDEDVHEEEDDGNEVDLPTKSKAKSRKNRLIVDEDVPEVELPTKSKAKPQKNRLYVEVDVQDEDENEMELPTTSKPKSKKKRSNVEENATETSNGDEPTIDIDVNQPQHETDDNSNKLKSTARPSRKRKHESVTNSQLGASEPSTSRNVSVAKRSKMSKWYLCSAKIDKYDALKPREAVQGVRHSARERRLPVSKLSIVPPKRTTTSNRSTSHKTMDTTVQRRTVSSPQQSNHIAESENLVSMLLKDSVDKEPPLITKIQGIEIAQGFHKTVKNNLVIHHIPGETGPSYGYFRLEPGMVKRSCRISWNLHIHIVSGPIEILIEGDSATMITGSFASLPSGTKYSMRNQGENPALVFFNQHLS